MCTPDYIHPSPQDLRGLKLSRFRNFRYFKKRTKPIYIDIDLQRQLLDPSGHPRRAVPHFQNIPLFFALPPAIQFLLPSTSFFNTCGTVIPPLWKILQVSRSESEKKLFQCHVQLQSVLYILNYNLCSITRFDIPSSA